MVWNAQSANFITQCIVNILTLLVHRISVRLAQSALGRLPYNQSFSPQSLQRFQPSGFHGRSYSGGYADQQ